VCGCGGLPAMLAAVSEGRVYGFQVIQETGLPG
jgi:hypothetical protein